MPMTCPAADGEYNPETDQLLSRIEQIFDFTTDTNTVDWADLSGDGCIDRAHGSADPLQQQRDVLGHRRSDHDHRCIRRAGLGKRAAVRYQLHGPFSEHGQRACTAFRRQLRCASSH